MFASEEDLFLVFIIFYDYYFPFIKSTYVIIVSLDYTYFIPVYSPWDQLF